MEHITLDCMLISIDELALHVFTLLKAKIFHIKLYQSVSKTCRKCESKSMTLIINFEVDL